VIVPVVIAGWFIAKVATNLDNHRLSSRTREKTLNWKGALRRLSRVFGPNLLVREKNPVVTLELQSTCKASQSHYDLLPHIMKAIAVAASSAPTELTGHIRPGKRVLNAQAARKRAAP
jgi:hypothetical protein